MFTIFPGKILAHSPKWVVQPVRRTRPEPMQLKVQMPNMHTAFIVA